jgi:hypothetical protein
MHPLREKDRRGPVATGLDTLPRLQMTNQQDRVAATPLRVSERRVSEMAAIQRSSNVVWEGTIARGAGRLSAHSGAFTALPVTVASRFGEPEGKTSPEELIAAAHATCFTMALGLVLVGEHTRTREEYLSFDEPG